MYYVMLGGGVEIPRIKLQGIINCAILSIHKTNTEWLILLLLFFCHLTASEQYYI